MADLVDGEVAHIKGSAKDPYELKNTGGVYSCSCPAWRNAGGPIDRRTCKHLKAYRGVDAEAARLGIEVSAMGAVKAKVSSSASSASSASSSSSSSAAASSSASEATAPPVLLAHSWNNEMDLSGWWMSEKLDGVRAYWDGVRFVSRLGNPFFAPSWFTDGMPSHPLDGELWLDRKRFQECVSIVRRQDAGDAWKALRYLVFDVPHLEDPFEARVDAIHQQFGAGQHPYVQAHAHVRCEGTSHLRAELQRVEALGGEGLMLRQPQSRYEVGRSHTLLKVKTFFDAEGRVVGHEQGKGKHKDRLGALVVEMETGTRFNVGTGLSDKERESPPPIGAIITYRYQELSKDGVPRFPTYVGIAIDKAAPTTAPSKSTTSSAPATATLAPAPSTSSAPKKTTTKSTTTTMLVTGEGDGELFWEVRLHGARHTVRFGRVGVKGQQREKAFATEQLAAEHAQRMIELMMDAGYRVWPATSQDTE